MAKSKTFKLGKRSLKELEGVHPLLVPYINGKLRWEWDAIYPIAQAVRMAAKNIGPIPLRWGGCWDKSFTASSRTPEEMVEDYVSRRRAMGKRASIDGPHYELPRASYPA